jgi:DNA-binding MarR family transcriptional regulator
MSERHYKVETYEARNSVGYLVKRSYAMMLDGLEPAFAEHGFTYMQYVVLMQLRSGAALNLRDISREFRHDSGALTRVIDQLAERGLVERQRCARDRRRVDLHLTAAGLRTCEQLIPLVVDKLNAALADFSRSEREELLRLLGKFIGGMQTALGVA